MKTVCNLKVTMYGVCWVQTHEGTSFYLENTLQLGLPWAGTSQFQHEVFLFATESILLVNLLRG